MIHPVKLNKDFIFNPDCFHERFLQNICYYILIMSSTKCYEITHNNDGGVLVKEIKANGLEKNKKTLVDVQSYINSLNDKIKIIKDVFNENIQKPLNIIEKLNDLFKPDEKNKNILQK